MAGRSGSWRIGFLALAAALLAGACGEEAVRQEGVSGTSLAAVPDTAWRALAAKRIFFGHQSVGGNIMDGVADVLRDRPALGLRVAAGEDALADGQAGFAHGAVGRNGDPGRKTDDFAKLVEGPLRGRVDVAFHKYCYVDITESTDVPAVFARYRDAMARLRAGSPEVVFVHVTTPLVSVPSGPRAAIKKLLGRSSPRIAANLARERFNDLMREAYGGKEPLFDLAAIESTRPDGSRETLGSGDRAGYALVPAYSSDGSHLGETGRRRVAEELLAFLARLPAAK